MMKQQSAPKQALKQLPDVFSLWLFLSHSRLRRRRASCLRGEFQSRRKLDFEDDGDLLEINVVSVVSGDEGKRGKDKRDANVKIHRPETRFGCLAKMKIRYCRVSQKYIVFEFGAVHTHTLCTPSKSHLFKSHRKFAPAQALEADMANDSVLILQHAADIFTPEVFKLLNAELCKAWDCDMDQCSEDGTVTTYKITPHGKSRHHIVTYDSIEELTWGKKGATWQSEKGGTERGTGIWGQRIRVVNSGSHSPESSRTNPDTTGSPITLCPVVSESETKFI
ncbi:hypothetical protein RHGRI_005458 [Rhododendron griersonianum]|uniref:FAR1 domain-containing protein n=1 Tax=Rhododendron griersonianum TaxID=479676 RepID=A0AAV6LCD1_9ERIC|nr:hypothetical protein RHGRI_005458 [Rhododendron griersonianum]